MVLHKLPPLYFAKKSSTMTDRQLNFGSMAETTISTAENKLYKPIWEKNTRIVNQFDGIKQTAVQISTVSGVQILSLQGYTLNKHQLWLAAANISEHVCNGLLDYYDDQKDSVHEAQVSFTITNFLQGDVTECINRMQLVHDLAVTIDPATLNDYQVSADDVKNQGTLIANLIAAVPGYRSNVSISKGSTSQLVDLFKLWKDQFKKLDRQIKTYKKNYPEFVEVYFNARKIIDLGKTQKSEQVHLMPTHFEDFFTKKFEEGDTLIVRNHGKDTIKVYINDNTKVLPADNGIEVKADEDVKLSISEDFGGVFGHSIIIYNPSKIENADVTLILSHGKSTSKASTVGKTA